MEYILNGHYVWIGKNIHYVRVYRDTIKNNPTKLFTVYGADVFHLAIDIGTNTPGRIKLCDDVEVFLKLTECI